jgi:hypothetical protein
VGLLAVFCHCGVMVSDDERRGWVCVGKLKSEKLRHSCTNKVKFQIPQKVGFQIRKKKLRKRAREGKKNGAAT